MKKCDFCDQSSPSGGCPYGLQATRESYCRKAIKNMVKALGDKTQEKRHRK